VAAATAWGQAAAVPAWVPVPEPELLPLSAQAVAAASGVAAPALPAQVSKLDQADSAARRQPAPAP